MKRILSIAMISVFLLGCGAAATESGVYQHKALYASWDHLWFSWGGYKNCDEKYVKQSKAEGWWGTPSASCTSQSTK
ncbi:MAG: hypothetical protein ACLP9S_01745 [Syntrophales bacterium]